MANVGNRPINTGQSISERVGKWAQHSGVLISFVTTNFLELNFTDQSISSVQKMVQRTLSQSRLSLLLQMLLCGNSMAHLDIPLNV